MATMTSMREVLLNTPVKISFAGFESDTWQLQQAGWNIAAEQDVAYAGLRLALRNEHLHLYAVSQLISFEYMHYRNGGYDLVEALRHLVVPIIYMAPRIQCVEVVGNFSKFKPIDAEPMWANQNIRDLEDFNIFRTLDKSKELIVEPQTVAEMLQQIKKYQEPKQKEIRENLRKKRLAERKFKSFLELQEVRPLQDVHAQIITIAA